MRTMLVSSVILAVAGFALGAMSSEEMVKVLGILLGRGAVIALVLCITFLPAFVLFFDKLISLLTIGAKFYKGDAKEEIQEKDEEPCIEN
jgi:predicted RND superfamily exporter protein